MFTGEQFSLRTPTIAFHMIGGRRVAVTVPAGTIVKVLSGPTTGDRMIEVLFENRPMVMFAIDLQERGEEIKAQ
jgi:hypothetical protein